jgi:hypothetical protein
MGFDRTQAGFGGASGQRIDPFVAIGLSFGGAVFIEH